LGSEIPFQLASVAAEIWNRAAILFNVSPGFTW
jgi:hypothetical protein